MSGSSGIFGKPQFISWGRVRAHNAFCGWIFRERVLSFLCVNLFCDYSDRDLISSAMSTAPTLNLSFPIGKFEWSGPNSDAQRAAFIADIAAVPQRARTAVAGLTAAH